MSSGESEVEEKRRKQDDLILYQEMMEQLKAKFKEATSYAQKLQILTLSPFTIKRTEKEFGATNYMVKRSRRLKELFGILGLPEKKKGKNLSDETMKRIQAFYQDEQVSRILPGKKDYKSVRSKSGERVQHQKYLLLGNLKELHQKWRQDGNPDVGFSTFAALRPPWCILAGAQGTHSICVCTHHQNPKLMIAALQLSEITYGDLMEMTVCSQESEECMMRRCKKCPGKDSLITHLSSLEELEVLEEIEYKQWVSTDKTTLVTITQQVEDFIGNLASKTVDLTRHHFTAKAQNTYLKDLKQAIKADECILIGDFAENYSFIVQDAAQGFHWENTQATLHPFVAYYRSSAQDNSLLHTSMCIISDSRKHTTAAVYTYQKHVLPHLQKILPKLNKIHYFSDGCAGQYKNRYNFINLCNHQEDFHLECEWNFFATAHGKSPCDGIGGTVKRLTAKASLQRPVDGQILTPRDMFKFCQESLQGKLDLGDMYFCSKSLPSGIFESINL